MNTHLLGYHQEVHWCLRVDVSEGQALFVLVDDLGRDLLAYDLVEYRWRAAVSEPFSCRFLRGVLFSASHSKHAAGTLVSST